MNKRFFFNIGCIAFISMLLVGCKVKRPDTVIPESTMENLLYDYHIAKSLGDDVNHNENYKKALYIDAVFNKYGITQAEFDSSMVWYTRHTEILAQVYEKVTAKLKTKQAVVNQLVSIRDKKPLTSAPGDSVDVWAWKRLLKLTSAPLDNTFTFILPSDSNFKERDAFVWEAYYRMYSLPSDSNYAPIMAMQIIFDNDSIVAETEPVYNSGFKTMHLEADTFGKIREVKGFIYYPLQNNTHSLLIDQISLMRYHINDSIVSNDSITHIQVSKDTVSTINNAEAVDKIEEKIQENQIQQRLTPEEMNRRRSASERIVKPEQKEVEQHIKEEQKELQRQNQRRQPVRR